MAFDEERIDRPTILQRSPWWVPWVFLVIILAAWVLDGYFEVPDCGEVLPTGFEPASPA